MDQVAELLALRIATCTVVSRSGADGTGRNVDAPPCVAALHPERRHKQVALGDDFRLHPEVALTVAHIDPPRALVVRGGVGPGGRPTAGEPAAPYDFTWAFVLTGDGPSHTRLLIRERYLYRTPWARPLVETVTVVSFAMTERMLRGIRDRAEGRLR